MQVDWQPVGIEFSDEREGDEDPTPPFTAGLEAAPEVLQAQFMLKADHLAEVRAARSNLMAIAGEIPDKAQAVSQTYLDASMIVDELNGRQTESGLSIPLQGVAFEQIRLDCARLEQGRWLLRLGIETQELDSEAFVRTFTLPERSAEPEARWFANELRISF